MEVDAIDAQARALYGPIDWPSEGGVLQVAAIAAAGRRIIALGPEAPKSAMDRFVLGLARARADAIVTTGAILRAEPSLVHRYGETEEDERAFAAWRRTRLGREERPSLIVLSGSGDFSRDHPAIEAASGGFVWTRAETADQLRERIGVLGIECPEPGAEEEGLGILGAIARARRNSRIQTILVEAGPTAADAIYPLVAGGDASRLPTATAAGRIDELLLSIFEGELAPAAVGPPFVAERRVIERLGVARSSFRLEESSGPWCFTRHRAD